MARFKFRTYCQSIRANDALSYSFDNPEAEFNDFQRNIIQDYERLNGGQVARTIDFLSLANPVAIKPIETLFDRIQNTVKGPALSVTEKVLDFQKDNTSISIVVIVNHAGNGLNAHTRQLSSRWPNDNYGSAAYGRPMLVESLYRQALDEGFVLVRGTPASGKTTLLHLLQQFIEFNHPEHTVEVIPYWMPRSEATGERTKLEGRLQHFSMPRLFLSDLLSFLRGHETNFNKFLWLLMDEAQTSYWDLQLWTHLLKAIQDRKPKGIHVVLFASYGSQRGEHHGQQAFQSGIPLWIPARAILGLIPTLDVPSSLLFTAAEYTSFIGGIGQGLHSNRWPQLDPDLSEYFFGISTGHIGAITALLCMAASAKKRLLQLSTLSYDGFMSIWNTPDKFMDGLRRDGDAFCRGLPRKLLSAYSALWTRILRRLITAQYVDEEEALVIPGSDPEELEAIGDMKLQGWIYVHESTVNSDHIALRFPSPLHLSWFSYNLSVDTPLPPDVASMTFEQFWKRVLAGFSHAALRNPPHANPRISVETRFRNEFYRSLHSLTRGAMAVSAEYGQYAKKRGHIDFFIISKGWGIELLCDGNQAEEHLQRFDTAGAYHPWVEQEKLSGFVVLDFRVSALKKAHPVYPHLHHVVYTEDFSEYQIWNHMLVPEPPVTLSM